MVQADADGSAVIPAYLEKTCELLASLFVVPVEIAGVDTYLVHQRCHGNGSSRGKMDVGHDRCIDAFGPETFPDFGYGSDFSLSRDGYADDLRTGFRHPYALTECRFHIVRMGVAHGLHYDGMTSADSDITASDFQGFHFFSSPNTIVLASLRSMALVFPVFLEIWKCRPAVTITSKGYAKE